MSSFIFCEGVQVTLDELCKLKIYNKRIYTKFRDSKNLHHTAILHRYENCVLSGNILRDKINTSICDGIATRPDAYYYTNNIERFPIINNIDDNTYIKAETNNKKKIGFLFRTLRDTSYPMFVVSCIPLFWYLKQIFNYKDIKNEKITLVIGGGTNGGWLNPLYCISTIIQSRIINKIKEKNNVSWEKIHTEINSNTEVGIKLKNIILTEILKWKEKNNYNHPIENIEIGFDLSYILDIIKLLTEDYNVEFILEDKPIYFEYLYVGAPLAANFCNLFPSLSPSINTIFHDLRIKCLNKECNIKKNVFDKCYITRYDKMYGLSQSKVNGPTGRKIINEGELDNCLKKLNFEFINASYYTTLEKFHLFKDVKIFVLMEGGGLANMMFFPPNSKIIIITNGGWNNITKNNPNNSSNRISTWWNMWNEEHYGHLNHTIYMYNNITCLHNKSPSEITSKINNINHLHNLISNVI